MRSALPYLAAAMALPVPAMALAAQYGQADFGDSLFRPLDGAPAYTGEIAPATEETRTVRMSTTTSVNDSGLLGSLLPVFEEKYGYTVEVHSAGTGKAISQQMRARAPAVLTATPLAALPLASTKGALGFTASRV